MSYTASCGVPRYSISKTMREFEKTSGGYSLTTREHIGHTLKSNWHSHKVGIILSGLTAVAGAVAVAALVLLSITVSSFVLPLIAVAGGLALLNMTMLATVNTKKDKTEYFKSEIRKIAVFGRPIDLMVQDRHLINKIGFLMGFTGCDVADLPGDIE